MGSSTPLSRPGLPWDILPRHEVSMEAASPHPSTSSHLADFFLDDRVKEGLGHQPALYCGDRVWSFQELATASDQGAQALLQAGIQPEQRVLLCLDDGPAWVIAFFSVLKAGAVVVKVSPDLPATDYAHFLSYSRARLAFTHERLRDTLLSQGTPWLSRVVTVESDWDAFLATGRPERPLLPHHPDEAACWLFTTGSTGAPKAAVHCHASFIHAARRYGGEVIGYRPGDLALSVPKLFFGYATGAGLLFPFAFGAATVLLPERSTPEAIFEAIARYRPTVLVNVPTMVQRMCADSQVQSRDLSSLRVAISAGEALPSELHHRWQNAFGVELLDGIGTSEMWHIFISNRLGAVRPGSVGQVVPGYQARVVGENGEDVPPGEVGTLWIQGGSRALYYFLDHAKSQAVFRGPWYITGDQFRRDADGWFWFCGRSDDLMKVGGRWVSPIEVEDCLLRHPAVSACAILGVTGEDGLTTPLAFVVSTPGTLENPALARDLREFCKSHLAPYKAPREVRFVSQLPRNDRGKVDRKELRSLL